jgi:hypothetical protein
MGANNVPVVGSKNFLDEKLGQLTLSQDRCWITMAGVNARAGTVPGYPASSRGPAFSFVAIANINSLYWQANDGTVDALKSNLTSETAFSASIPRAVALGRSAADDFSTVLGGSNPFIDVLFYATGVTAAPSFHGLIWSSNFNNPSPVVQPTKFPFILDPTNFVGTTVRNLCLRPCLVCLYYTYSSYSPNASFSPPSSLSPGHVLCNRQQLPVCAFFLSTPIDCFGSFSGCYSLLG